MTRRAIVHRISASAPDDVSGIEAAIASQRIDPKGVIAVLAKTEGNGLVNDFSRGHATLALSLLFERHLATEEAARVCLVMSGGTEGAMAPHWLVFERAEGEPTRGGVVVVALLGRRPEKDPDELVVFDRRKGVGSDFVDLDAGERDVLLEPPKRE